MDYKQKRRKTAKRHLLKVYLKKTELNRVQKYSKDIGISQSKLIANFIDSELKEFVRRLSNSTRFIDPDYQDQSEVDSHEFIDDFFDGFEEFVKNNKT